MVGLAVQDHMHPGLIRSIVLAGLVISINQGEADPCRVVIFSNSSKAVVLINQGQIRIFVNRFGCVFTSLCIIESTF